MPTEQIVQVLVQERDRLNRAIEALQGSSRGGAVSSGGAKRGGRRPVTAAEKKAHSERMKRFWAAQRAKK
jgi:hypothetical protein